MKEGTEIIIFFTIPALLIEAISFVVGALIFQPIDRKRIILGWVVSLAELLHNY